MNKKTAAKKTTSKKTTAKKAVAKNSDVKQVEAKKVIAKKPEVKSTAKAVSEKKTTAQIRVTQTGSAIRREGSQRKTLIGLGLNKVGRSRVLEDTPSIRGMVRKVQHMVKMEQV